MEKYDVISVVGEGSYGLVMRCRHRETGHFVAIKKFLETEDDPTVRKMAMREIRMLKKLRHENLVNMIEVFRRKKRFFLVFEYLEHTVLEELEARSGGLGFITSRKYIFQILRALDFIHSNNVIHRDIKPENVLVSRLGVIKLCDFGFARPFTENETFTDYVATRWYRSPELLVGDPRYGKEVDIWATGCLYAEMMTGEPLFPGESDVDQLFQIVRILGKVNTRHQLLITRNTLFKGMKQEQNSSLNQLFPDWNRDSLDFLNQCLKMDGSARPDTVKLLKHDLFTRDDFVDLFLPELRAKISQEMNGNPLLKRLQGFPANRKPEERKSSNGSITSNLVEKPKELIQQKPKDKTNQIGLSLSQMMVTSNHHPQLPEKPLINSKFTEAGYRSSQGSDDLNLNLAQYKHYLNAQHSKNLYGNHKPINVNTLTFTKENHGQSQKYGARILSAKPQKTIPSDKTNTTNQISNNSNLEGIHIQPPSPVQFQSLQHENVSINSNYSHLIEKPIPNNSPLTVNNLTLTNNIPTYFANKRSTNILSNFQRPPMNPALATTNQMSNVAKNSSPAMALGVARSNLMKRERGLLLDVGPLPYGMMGSTPESMKTEPSPRVLAPPAWLMGNMKVSSLGKTTQIGKRGLTDWKSVSQSNPASNNDTSTADLVLPNCPGASRNTSPVKNLKKKLAPMTTTLPGTINFNNENIFTTPRKLSPTSPKKEL